MATPIQPLTGRAKYHIARQSWGDGVHYIVYCGRYITKDRIESMDNIGDDDDQESLFCLKCLDQWHVRNPFV